MFICSLRLALEFIYTSSGWWYSSIQDAVKMWWSFLWKLTPGLSFEVLKYLGHVPDWSHTDDGERWMPSSRCRDRRILFLGWKLLDISHQQDLTFHIIRRWHFISHHNIQVIIDTCLGECHHLAQYHCTINFFEDERGYRHNRHALINIIIVTSVC